MSLDDDAEKSLDKTADAPPKGDVLAPDEAKSVQEDASKNAAERGRFLADSLGKAMSPSTEILKDMVVSIFDEGKKVVGVGSGELPRVDLPAAQALDASVASPSDLAGKGPGSKAGTDVEPPGTGPVAADLNKDAADIRKATEKDDWIDTGTDEKKIFKAMEGKTPEQVLEMKNIYARDNNGADLEADLRDELSDSDYARVKDQLADAKALERLKEDPEVKAEHAKLEQRAKETMKDPELAEFMKNMDKFEGRAASLERQYQKEFEAKGMNPDEAAREAEKKAGDQVEKTYQNMEKLLEKSSTAPVPESDRIVLAQQAMQHVADPTTISQGENSTCSVASLETRTYTKDPAAATDLVAQVASKGEYTTNGTPPVTVHLDAESLKKQGQSNELPPQQRGDGHRDYASQMFQVTAFNVALEKQNQSTTPPGQLKYEQHTPVPGANPPPDDNGARLVDYSKVNPTTGKPPLEVDRDPGMTPPDLAVVAKEVSPGNSDGPVAIERDMERETRQLTNKILLESELKRQGIGDGQPIDINDPESLKKTREAIEQKQGLDPNKKAELLRNVNELETDSRMVKDKTLVEVKSEEEMKETLAQLKKDGKLPVIIFVDTGNEPYFTDSGGGAAGGAGGRHFVTVTDYDESTGVAKMQNQWDKASSHDMSTKDLYDATRNPKHRVDDLQREVDKNRESWFGDVDYGKEYELLRLKQQEGKISDADYDKQIADLTRERYKHWKENGSNPDDAKYKRESKQVGTMLRELEKTDPERVKKIKEAVTEAKKEIDG